MNSFRCATVASRAERSVGASLAAGCFRRENRPMPPEGTFPASATCEERGGTPSHGTTVLRVTPAHRASGSFRTCGDDKMVGELETTRLRMRSLHVADTTGTAFDIVVLGGGSGGYAAALRAAELGKTVALVESGKVGGTCLHNGCIPTKALLHAAELADGAREGAHFGIHTSLEKIDMAGVNQYKETVIGRLYKGLQGLIKSRDITVFEGHGRLVGQDAVEVDGQRITGGHVVLATGSYARSLPGLEIGGRVITSDQALQLDWVPKSIVILGGGVIGSEFASVYRSFGADVTIIEALPHLVPNEDDAVCKAFERAYRKRGIAFHLGVRFSGV